MIQANDSSARIARNPDLVAAEMDGETVMMSIERGEYYGLNRVGSHIWDLLESSMSIDELCNCLVEKFDIAPEQCREEVLGFVNDLLEKDIITLC